MKVIARSSLSLICFLTLLTSVQTFNNTNSTGTSVVSAVALDNNASFAVCVYPASVSLPIKANSVEPEREKANHPHRERTPS